MEAWRHGGMEAWRFGGMEVWRHRGLSDGYMISAKLEKQQTVNDAVVIRKLSSVCDKSSCIRLNKKGVPLGKADMQPGNSAVV
jgi:hypothetical protein